MIHKFPQLILIAYCLLLLGCSRQTAQDQLSNQTSKENDRQFFIDSIAYNEADRSPYEQTHFVHFAQHKLNLGETVQNRFNPLIYALEEPYMDKKNLPNRTKWLRIIFNPTFYPPHCLTATLKNGKTHLTLSITDGKGGYYPGYLSHKVERIVADTVFTWITNYINSINLKALSKEKLTLDHADGEHWTLEYLSKGSYYSVERFSPHLYGSKKTRKMGELGLILKQYFTADSLISISLFRKYTINRN